MAHAIQSKRITPADELRELLAESEKRAVNIRGGGPQAARELLSWLDLIYHRLPELEAKGVDLGAERGQWQTVQGAVRRHERELRRELQAVGGLAALRQQLGEEPAPEQWWWWLDRIAARNLRQRLRRAAITGGIVLVLLFAARWALNYFFPVDPEVIASYNLQNTGEAFVEQGDYEQAIQSFEQALTHTPDDFGTQIWLVALYHQTGRDKQAQAQLDSLVAQYDASSVHASLAQHYLMLKQLDTGLEFALKAVDEDPDNPQAYMAVGSAYEAKGNFTQAMKYFDLAAKAAERVDMPEMQAMARIRMGQLLQQGSIAPLASPEG